MRSRSPPTNRLHVPARERVEQRLDEGSDDTDTIITVLSLDGSTIASLRLKSAAGEEALKHVTISEVTRQLSEITQLPASRIQLTNGTSTLGCTQTLEEAGLQRESRVYLVKRGHMLLTASEDGSAKLWNCGTGACVETVVSEGKMLSAEFAPTGSSCFVTSSTESIDVWTTEGWKRLASLGFRHGRISWSKDAPSVFAAMPGIILECFVYGDKNCAPLRCYRGHESRVNSAVQSNDKTLLLSGAEDCTARLWSRRDAQCLGSLSGHEAAVNSAEFSNDDSIIVTASSDHTAKLWTAASRDFLRSLQHQDVVSAARFSSDAKLIVTGCHDCTVTLWDTALGKRLRTFSGHEGPVLDVRFALHGTYIGSASADGFAMLWDFESGECVQVFDGHKGPVVSVSFSL